MLADGWVDVVASTCATRDQAALRSSDEHTAVGFIDPSTLTDDELPPVYRHLIDAAPHAPRGT